MLSNSGGNKIISCKVFFISYVPTTVHFTSYAVHFTNYAANLLRANRSKFKRNKNSKIEFTAMSIILISAILTRVYAITLDTLWFPVMDHVVIPQ